MRWRTALLLGLVAACSVLAAGQRLRVDAHGAPLPEGALQRLGTQRFATQGVMALSPDGKVVAGATDSAVQFLDPLTGTVVRTFPHDGSGDSLVFSPDGKTLAVFNFHVVSLWDVTQGKRRLWLERGERSPLPSHLSFSADSSFVCLATQSKGDTPTMSVGVWEVATGRKVDVEPFHQTLRGAALSGDGRLLALWGFTNGDEKATLLSLRTLQLWDTRTGKELKKLELAQNADRLQGCHAVAVSSDGKRVVVHTGRELALWDVSAGRELGRSSVREITSYSEPPTLRFSSDNKHLLCVGPGLTVQLWDATTFKHQGLFAAPDAPDPRYPFQPPVLVHTAEGKLLGLGSTGWAFSLWDVRSGQRLSPALGHQTPVTALGFTDDGRTLRSLAADGTLFHWDVRTGRESRRQRLDIDPNNSLSYHSPNGLRTLMRNRQLWDLGTGRRLHSYPLPPWPHEHRITLVAGFSPDGNHLILSELDANGDRLQFPVHDLRTGKQLARLAWPSDKAVGATLTPGAETAIVVSWENQDAGRSKRRCTVMALDVAADKVRWSFTGQGPARANPIVSPDGSLLALSGPEGQVFLLNPATGEEQLVLGADEPWHPGRLLFSPDGRTLTVAGTTVRVWELASGTVRRHLTESGVCQLVAYSPDGARLATSATRDRTVLVWDLTGRQDAPATEPELSELWEQLRNPDGRAALAAMGRLLAAPELAVTLFGRRLRPAPPVRRAAERIALLIADLDHRQFARREQAFAELWELGLQVMPALRRNLTPNASLELRRRIEELLRRLPGPTVSRDLLRAIRAVEVLERLGTPAATRLLETLAKGAAEARLTREATVALGRLTGRRAGE